MPKNTIKKSIFTRLRNNFIAGVVVLIPIGITLYLTLFLIKLSTNLIPKEINPNNYLPFAIPGLEILLSVLFITFINEYSKNTGVSIMDKCTYNDFCEFMYIKSTSYDKNLRYMYSDN